MAILLCRFPLALLRPILPVCDHSEVKCRWREHLWISCQFNPGLVLFLMAVPCGMLFTYWDEFTEWITHRQLACIVLNDKWWKRGFMKIRLDVWVWNISWHSKHMNHSLIAIPSQKCRCVWEERKGVFLWNNLQSFSLILFIISSMWCWYINQYIVCLSLVL